jgi:hypothetical protein
MDLNIDAVFCNSVLHKLILTLPPYRAKVGAMGPPGSGLGVGSIPPTETVTSPETYGKGTWRRVRVCR